MKRQTPSRSILRRGASLGRPGRYRAAGPRCAARSIADTGARRSACERDTLRAPTSGTYTPPSARRAPDGGAGRAPSPCSRRRPSATSTKSATPASRPQRRLATSAKLGIEGQCAGDAHHGDSGPIGALRHGLLRDSPRGDASRDHHRDRGPRRDGPVAPSEARPPRATRWAPGTPDHTAISRGPCSAACAELAWSMRPGHAVTLAPCGI